MPKPLTRRLRPALYALAALTLLYLAIALTLGPVIWWVGESMDSVPTVGYAAPPPRSVVEGEDGAMHGLIVQRHNTWGIHMSR